MTKFKHLINILDDVYDNKITSTDAQIEIINLLDINKRKNDYKFIQNVCLSYRHDFGLMSVDEQNNLIFEAKEWIRAITNNLPYD